MTSLKRPQGTDSYSPNLSSKTYVRSTKSGKVQKIVREVYLREDIPCSSKLCSKCLAKAPRNAGGELSPFILSDKPAGTKAYPQGHYLVPDTNALLNAMDLFEQSSAFYDVVILQTVLEELRNRSLPLYNRLIGLTKSEDKRFYVFFNEFRFETYVPRERDETINDRNDRAVRQAVKWYNDHLNQSKSKQLPVTVMLTDDRLNIEKAKKENVPATTLRDYVSGLEDADRLLDMIPESQEKGISRDKNTSEFLYPEYYTLSKMMTGVKSGILHQGIFNVSPYNYLEASIKVPAFPKALIVLGRENINRAVDGDVVVVEVLPQDQWKVPSTKIIEEETITKNESADNEEGGDIVTEQERRALQEQVKKTQGLSTEGRPQPTAKVVGIVKRNWRQYKASKSVFLIPMDKKVPKIRLRTRQAGEIVGKRILVAIDSWDRESRHPVGHFIRSLGELESKAAETEALLLDTDDPGWKDREDLRGLLICSIDPVGCQDIDDALHARPIPNGNFEVGVHIADVSHFVKPSNAMDTEASIRGTTVYLVDKRIDMLPMLLGTDLCSLKPYVERYAFSVLWEVNQDADIINVRFTKSVIKSREAFSYEQAQLRIDDASQQDDLTQGMRTLLMLSKKLKQKRMDAGALSLSSPEVKVEMESETSDPIDVKTKALLDTNSLVEEFMLLANISVAGKIYEAFPQTAILRRHAAPPKTNFDELANQLKVKRGIELHFDSSKALADSLDQCVDARDPFFNTLVRIMATRCMMSAEYFCAGTQAFPEFRHYGLASEIYTHFTRVQSDDMPTSSPIASSQPPSTVCKNINVRHRNAQLAGRASVAYYVGQSLRGRVAEEEGFVMKIFSNGFVVLVPRFGIEGLIRLRDLAEPEPESVFDADTYTLKTSGSREVSVELFMKVVVRIQDVKDEATGKRGAKMELVRAG
ncbi:Exosome complex exonuclease dis3 [Daldinia childiae]|uniref:Exosome complex exonuclease dis3 n=1 Tax=Daldinia childiae TaxID=326645 RepID=UPI001446D38B|nr:Exosome complex exonuclease dis3 [Daldinia childiae]KAF3058960.1 Exosome complex exonuclease dis3 [Daldinia childiae]